MAQSTYSDCGAEPSEAGCGTCDVCVVTAEAQRDEEHGTFVLTAEQTAQLLTHLRDEPIA